MLPPPFQEVDDRNNGFDSDDASDRNGSGDDAINNGQAIAVTVVAPQQHQEQQHQNPYSFEQSPTALVLSNPSTVSEISF